MDTQATWALEMTKDEFLCLAASLQLSMPLLIGQDVALAIDMDQQRIAQARERLLQRGIIDADPDGTLGLEEVAALLVAGATEPERRALLTATDRDGKTEQRLVHMLAQLIVEQEEHADGYLLLTAIRDADVLLSRIADLLCAADVVAAPGGTCCLPASALAEAQELALAAEHGACVARLAAGGASSTTASALARALREATSIGSIMAWPCAEGAVAERYGYIAGEDGAWLLCLEGEGHDLIGCVPKAMADIASLFCRTALGRRDM